MEVANLIAPEHLELLVGRSRGAASRWCATPARCSAGRGHRRRSATTSPVRATCCRRTARPASPARSPSSDFAKHVHVIDARSRRVRQGRPARRGAGRGRGLRRPRRSIAPAGTRGETRRMTRVAMRPRDDVALMDGLPLAAGRRRRAAQHQRVARCRRPRAGTSARPTSCRRGRMAPLSRSRRAPSCGHASPTCTASRPSRSSRRTARTRCCRRCCLTYGGPGRTAAVFEPTYALARHIAGVTGTAVVDR